MYERYKIKKGDTLNSVANDFNTSVEFLKNINNLFYLDELRENQDIIVPKNKAAYFNFYKIEEGDTLFNIAKKYNINPELLTSLNGLNKEDYIYPNQEILIPKAEYSYYITKEGDTIETVADTFKITKDRILNQNPTLYLLEGQIIVNKRK